MLGDRDACGSRDDGRGGRYVEGLGAAGPCPGGIHEASVTGAQHHHAGPHGLGQSHDFIDALAFFCQSNQHAGNLRVGGLAVEDVAQQFGRFRARQVASREDSPEHGPEPVGGVGGHGWQSRGIGMKSWV